MASRLPLRPTQRFNESAALTPAVVKHPRRSLHLTHKRQSSLPEVQIFAPAHSHSRSADRTSLFSEPCERAFTLWFNSLIQSHPVDSAHSNAAVLRSRHSSAWRIPRSKFLSVRNRGREFLKSNPTVLPLFFRLDREIDQGKIAFAGQFVNNSTSVDDSSFASSIGSDVDKRQQLLDLFFNSYEPNWLAVGLECALEFHYRTVYRSNNAPIIESPVNSVANQRKFLESYILCESNRGILKIFLKICFILDRLSNEKVNFSLCEDNENSTETKINLPLFQSDAAIDSTRHLLDRFSALFLLEGNLVKSLSLMGFKCLTNETSSISMLEESAMELKKIEQFRSYEYEIRSIATDFRDGIRFMRALDILTAGNRFQLMKLLNSPNNSNSNSTISANDSSATHNLRSVFRLLASHSGAVGIPVENVILGDCSSTLQIIWQLILRFEIERISVAAIREEIATIRKCHNLKSNKIGSNSSKDKKLLAGEEFLNSYMTSESIEGLLQWIQWICVIHYNFRGISNFTTSFRNGIPLALLIHYYFPNVLPLANIQLQCEKEEEILLNQSKPDDQNNNKWRMTISFKELTHKNESPAFKQMKENWNQIYNSLETINKQYNNANNHNGDNKFHIPNYVDSMKIPSWTQKEFEQNKIVIDEKIILLLISQLFQECVVKNNQQPKQREQEPISAEKKKSAGKVPSSQSKPQAPSSLFVSSGSRSQVVHSVKLIEKVYTDYKSRKAARDLRRSLVRKAENEKIARFGSVENYHHVKAQQAELVAQQIAEFQHRQESDRQRAEAQKSLAAEKIQRLARRFIGRKWRKSAIEVREFEQKMNSFEIPTETVEATEMNHAEIEQQFHALVDAAIDGDQLEENAADESGLLDSDEFYAEPEEEISAPAIRYEKPHEQISTLPMELSVVIEATEIEDSPVQVRTMAVQATPIQPALNDSAVHFGSEFERESGLLSRSLTVEESLSEEPANSVDWIREAAIIELEYELQEAEANRVELLDSQKLEAAVISLQSRIRGKIAQRKLFGLKLKAAANKRSAELEERKRTQIREAEEKSRSERVKLEAEAKAKAKAEADAQAQAEAEARAKVIESAQKAEAEKLLQAQASAALAKAQAEAKAKAASEAALVKAQAAAKARTDAEAAAAQSQAKLKARIALIKSQAEAKARQESEARIREQQRVAAEEKEQLRIKQLAIEAEQTRKLEAERMKAAEVKLAAEIDAKAKAAEVEAIAVAAAAEVASRLKVAESELSVPAEIAPKIVRVSLSQLSSLESARLRVSRSADVAAEKLRLSSVADEAKLLKAREETAKLNEKLSKEARESRLAALKLAEKAEKDRRKMLEQREKERKQKIADAQRKLAEQTEIAKKQKLERVRRLAKPIESPLLSQFLDDPHTAIILLAKEAEKFAAAVKIQALARKYAAQRELKKLQEEKRQRDAELARLTKLRFESAVLIQNQFRCFQARMQLRALKMAREQQLRLLAAQRESAAIIIQSAWRRVLAHRQLDELKSAAALRAALRNLAQIKIASIWRMKVAQRELSQLRVLFQQKINRAAIVIQSRVRAFLGRKHFKQTRLAVIRIQSICRMVLAVRELAALRIAEAVRIHGVCERAAICIQSHYRSLVARRELAALKLVALHNRSATRISSLAKKYIARREYLINRQNLIKLQSVWRGFHVRKTLGFFICDLRWKLYALSGHRNAELHELESNNSDSDSAHKALSKLINSKSGVSVVHALNSLRHVIETVPLACEPLIQQSAVEILHRLLLATPSDSGRESFHIEVAEISIEILLQLFELTKSKSRMFQNSKAVPNELIKELGKWRKFPSIANKLSTFIGFGMKFKYFSQEIYSIENQSRISGQIQYFQHRIRVEQAQTNRGIVCDPIISAAFSSTVKSLTSLMPQAF